MSFLARRYAPFLAIAPALIGVAPNAPGIEVTDFAGTVTQDSSKIHLVRAIADPGSGYDKVAPGARVRLGAASPIRHELKVRLNFTGLVTRLDSYNPIGSIYVDGALVTDFGGPGEWSFGQPHPTGIVEVAIPVEAGSRTVEVILPYGASVDVVGFVRATTATITAPTPRTAQKCVFLGDSIEHGFSASMIRLHWTFLLAQAKGWQHISLGYGGRDLVTADFPIAAGLGAQRTITNYGINDGFEGTAPSAIQSKAQDALSGFRAVSATQLLHWINIFDCANPLLITAPANIRSAIAAAFAARGGPRDILIPGGTANGLPAASLSPDQTHPTDAMSVTIANVIGGQVA